MVRSVVYKGGIVGHEPFCFVVYHCSLTEIKETVHFDGK